MSALTHDITSLQFFPTKLSFCHKVVSPAGRFLFVRRRNLIESFLVFV